MKHLARLIALIGTALIAVALIVAVQQFQALYAEFTADPLADNTDPKQRSSAMLNAALWGIPGIFCYALAFALGRFAKTR